MATIEEVLAVLNSILDKMSYRFDGGDWGEPTDYSLLVRQDQPPSSGTSQFKCEDLPMAVQSVIARGVSGDIQNVPLSEQQVLGRLTGGNVGAINFDHGSLSGLADDDHSQYHNDTRGDARYSQLGHSHTESDITDLDHYTSGDFATDFSGSNLANLGTKSHTSLTDIGSSSHATIDTHLGSSSNPHSVTKTQVSLGNVTDDSQLKRAAADFATFDEKTTPVDDDLLLIEDSEATGAKKKLKISNLPGGGSGAVHFRASIGYPFDGGNYGIGYTDVAITITQMNAVLVGSDSQSIDWTVMHSTDRDDGSPNEVVTGGTTTTSTSTGSEVTMFNDATIPAGSWIWVETSSLAGKVNELLLNIDATED